jgi:hypothetical protein
MLLPVHHTQQYFQEYYQLKLPERAPIVNSQDDFALLPNHSGLPCAWAPRPRGATDNTRLRTTRTSMNGKQNDPSDQGFDLWFQGCDASLAIGGRCLLDAGCRALRHERSYSPGTLKRVEPKHAVLNNHSCAGSKHRTPEKGLAVQCCSSSKATAFTVDDSARTHTGTTQGHAWACLGT